jgi:hypothetical protein
MRETRKDSLESKAGQEKKGVEKNTPKDNESKKEKKECRVDRLFINFES